MGKIKKALLNATFLIGLVAITIYYTLKDCSVSEIFYAIEHSNAIWLIPAVVLVFTFVCGESVIMRYLYNLLGTSIKLIRCIKYSFVGFFYSCVTPSASGGQPMQLFYMTKDKYNVSESCLLLLLITVGYKAALVVMSGVLFMVEGSFIFEHLSSVVYIFIFGIIVNIAFISFLLILVFNEKLLKKMVSGLAKLLHKIKIVKDIEGFEKKILCQMEPYREGAEYLKKNVIVFFHVLWMSIVQRTMLFLVTWFVYRSFGLNEISAIQIVALQTIISLSVDMLPLPGGVGASEKSFSIMFATIFGAHLVIPGMVVSRGISYYFLLLVSGIISVGVHILMMYREQKARKDEYL